jgi:WD40 repeat protein
MKGKRSRAPLFGDDVFISYKRTEAASDYAGALASELTRKKIACYCDQYGTPPGDELSDSLRRRIRRSALFVLVGSAEIADSKPVREEVEEFLSTERPIIPITFKESFSDEGTLERVVWFKQIKGMALVSESPQVLDPKDPKYGIPSSKVINRIVNTEGFVSRNRRMLRKFWATVLATVAVLVSGGVGAAALLYNAWVEVGQVQQDRRYAERERERAGEARDWALVEQALAESQARDEQEKANRAEASADRAQERQQIAERQERQARAERLATAAEANLDEHPQRSLALAYAAVQILREAGDPGNAAAEQALRRALAGTGGLLLRHEASVGAVAISADSRWLATGSADGVIRVWDLTSDSPMKEPVQLRLDSSLLGVAPRVDQVELSPDGAWLIARSSWGVQLWDLGANPPQRFNLEDPGYVIHEIGFTPDGLRAVTVGMNLLQAGSVLVWDLATVGRSRQAVPLRVWGLTGDEFQRWRSASQKTRDPRMAFTAPSADFRWILTNQAGQAPVLLDLAAEDPQAEAITLPDGFESMTISGSVDIWNKFEISPDRRWLAASWVRGASDRSVYLWELRENKPVGLTRLKGEPWIVSLAFSPDSRWLVSGHHAQALLWDLESSRSATDWPLRHTLSGHRGDVAVTFSPDSELLATAGSNEADRREEGIRIWNLSASDPSKEFQILEGHRGAIHHLSFSPDGHWLSVAGSSAAELWKRISQEEEENEAKDAAFGEWGKWISVVEEPRRFEEPTFLRGHEGAIGNVAAFSPDSRWFITGGEDSVARLWDLEAQSWCATPRRLPGAKDIVWTESRGHWLVANDKTGQLFLWDLRTGPSARPVLLGSFPHLTRPDSIGVSSDGRWLALLSLHGSHLWNLERVEHWELRGLRYRIPAKVGFTPDGNWLLAGDARQVFRWNLRAGLPVEGVQLSPDDPSVKNLQARLSGLRWAPELDLLPTPAGEGKLDELELTSSGPVRRRRRTAVTSLDGRWLIVSQGAGVYFHPSGLEQLAREAREAGARSLGPEEWQEYFPGQPYREAVKNPLSGRPASPANRRRK